MEYLGHIVTPNGFKPNVRNIEAIKEFPVPTTLKELRQFLGLTSHYCRFVKGFAKIAQPLYALTKKDVPYYWTAECECAFDHLRWRYTKIISIIRAVRFYRVKLIKHLI